MAQVSQREILKPAPSDCTSRPVGGTEFSWCKAVPGGTGITVLGLLLSKPPNTSILQKTLHNLQNSHPILRSKIHFEASSNTFQFTTLQNPNLQIQPFDVESTSQIVRSESNGHDQRDPFHVLVEHELNRNTWHDSDDGDAAADADVMHASTYSIGEGEWFAVFLRMHAAACDRTAAAELLRELIRRLGGGGEDGGANGEEEVRAAIEDLIPEGKKHKPFWARGMDMIGYSLNGFRQRNLSFVDADSPRSSRVVRLGFEEEETKNLIDACKSRGIKLCGALAAAGMIAVWNSKRLPANQKEKYAAITLIDCRSDLEPVLSSKNVGFYNSAIMNTHDVGGETLWDLAKRAYSSFENAKNNNKHLSDMADLNFLMLKAMENPGMTPSSSLRTGLISVFEDPIIDDWTKMHEEIGVEDSLICGSAHGIGCSIAAFQTIRDGKLDCSFVYPSPLHSREQIQEIVNDMKRILVDGCTS